MRWRYVKPEYKARIMMRSNRTLPLIEAEEQLIKHGFVRVTLLGFIKHIIFPSSKVKDFYSTVEKIDEYLEQCSEGEKPSE